jgi:hypothetical protein
MTTCWFLYLQALMLPYVRTQDATSDEVAYHFSTDMIIEVNTVRGMRVLAYVLFDSLVQHVQHLEGANTTGNRQSVQSSMSAVETDSLTFDQWNSCFDDRGQAQRARRMIFAPHQLQSWRENKTNRIIRRQDFVQA